MGVDSNASRNDGKRAARVAKGVDTPSPKFPLRVHKGTGYWCKKINGRVYYFGKVSDDPTGALALEDYKRTVSGRENADSPGLTVNGLAGRFLDQMEDLVLSGERSPRSYAALKATAKRVVKVFGRERLVSDLLPDDFRLLRKRLSRGRNGRPYSAQKMKSEITRARQMFNFAAAEGEAVRFGTAFRQPSAKDVRREREAHRLKHGHRMFEATEIRRLLAVLGGERDPACPDDNEEEVRKPNLALRAMVLLGVNCGFGNTDIACLPLAALDLNTGWVEHARTKNSTPRRCPLWPETIVALQDYLGVRPKPRHAADAELVFLTAKQRTKWVKVYANGTITDGVSQEFKKVLASRGLARAKVGFYALRRVVETIGGDSLDQVAVDAILGHATPGMGSVYRQRIADDRLLRVTTTVREWLFPEKTFGKKSDPSDPRPGDPINVEDNGSGAGRSSEVGATRVRPAPGGRRERVATGRSRGSLPTEENPQKTLERVDGSQGSQFSENLSRWEATTAGFGPDGGDR
ncbi:hypothetical protein Pan44_43220 [Caulifigura coniformis]|uniref:Phage integrase family protein n=1 Tax=Caulifigura coniformis TaxID=2527983 RepID=A0A517SJG5_9PLAN|nr:hypothetical protein [Caulifigura coniformis]QDT56269.1 hypothetical protein Pan44_43220 [Caulifigura coniformis]